MRRDPQQEQVSMNTHKQSEKVRELSLFTELNCKMIYSNINKIINIDERI